MLSPCSDPGSEIECVFFSLKKSRVSEDKVLFRAFGILFIDQS